MWKTSLGMIGPGNRPYFGYFTNCDFVGKDVFMDAAIEFPPEKAWQAALANLQMDMSRAAFETWVKPACLEDFNNDTFVISCMNSYGRDWLADRLTSTLERFLCGVMNREIKVRFIVKDQEYDLDNSSDENDEYSSETDSTPVELDILCRSIRDSLLEPGRVVRLPVYFLRWLPYVQSQIIFVVMALWQEYYLASGGKAQKGNNKVSVRAEQVCQWAGISRAQFFRLLQPGSTLYWFARKTETDYEVDRRTGRAKKSSNKYVLLDTPLTPGDAEDLKAFLLDHGIRESPVSALQAAVAADPKQILSYPTRLPPDNFENMQPRYLTVQEIVRDLVGRRLTPELATLTDQLADRILAQGEFILVSWYFLKNWLPVLGSDAAMLILVLRNLCYFNDETGELRDEVWIEGGYEAIAQRLGIKNPRTVATWLPARIDHKKRKDELTDRTDQEFARRQRIQDLLGLFVDRTDHRVNSSGSYAWKFKVQRVDPLIPQHEIIRRAASSLLADCEDQGLLDELYSWVDEVNTDLNDCIETVKNGPKIVFRLSNSTNGCSETLTAILNDCFETLDLEGKDCFETLLKTLKRFKDSQKEKDTSSTQDSSNLSADDPDLQAVAAVTDSKGNWDLEKLLARADKKNRQILLNQEKDGQAFVSWVIHGASQASIQNPYSLAIAKLKENPETSAGGASERLAAYRPRQLAGLIEQELTFRSPSDRNWRMLFAQAKRDRIRLLADALGLILDIQEESWMSS
jgi:hypothetical protein